MCTGRKPPSPFTGWVPPVGEAGDGTGVWREGRCPVFTCSLASLVGTVDTFGVQAQISRKGEREHTEMGGRTSRWEWSEPGGRERFPEALRRLPGLPEGPPPPGGTDSPCLGEPGGQGQEWGPREGLGFCAFGADPRRGCLRPLTPLPRPASGSDMSNPKWTGGGLGSFERSHTKRDFISGLLWLILQLCKYVRRHF